MSKFSDFFLRLTDLEEPPAHVLEELGLTAADFMTVMRGAPGRRQRYLTMAAQLGLSEEDIAAIPGLQDKVCETCASCGTARACQKAIYNFEPLPEEGCPNLGRYQSIAAG